MKPRPPATASGGHATDLINSPPRLQQSAAEAIKPTARACAAFLILRMDVPRHLLTHEKTAPWAAQRAATGSGTVDACPAVRLATHDDKPKLNRLTPSLMFRRTAGLLLVLFLVLASARAEPVTRREVLAAIAGLENDVTGADAVDAAATVARFGQESDSVLITVGAETLPWVQTDVSEAEAKVRALLMAAYFAGDIKSQLEKRRPVDDPYSGWLSVIKAYRQILRKQPDMVIPEIEELVKKERAGTLKHEADELRRLQDEEQKKGRRPTNMV